MTAPFRSLTARAAPLPRDDVDTDAIFPARYYTLTGDFGRALFANWRLLPDGSPDPGFVLNRPEHAGARILVAGVNFGCGSSREHAVWALRDGGIGCVIAAGFGPIFFDNAVLSGVLPASLPPDEARALADAVAAAPDAEITVCLETRRILGPGAEERTFDIPAEARATLLEGADPIARTLRFADEIDAFRAADRLRRPWAWSHAAGRPPSTTQRETTP
jgi:3-isopropylmalate/(R)-2-methylmalate dehydratase small subunit